MGFKYFLKKDKLGIKPVESIPNTAEMVTSENIKEEILKEKIEKKVIKVEKKDLNFSILKVSLKETYGNLREASRKLEIPYYRLINIIRKVVKPSGYEINRICKAVNKDKNIFEG